MPSLVVDCDSHVMEPATLWQEYLEPKYRANAIRIDEDARGSWHAAGRPQLRPRRRA